MSQSAVPRSINAKWFSGASNYRLPNIAFKPDGFAAG
jgi:hypothetical protein